MRPEPLMNSNRQNSRFSTLKVFNKFSSQRPPPPPPKDKVYLADNRSFVSISESSIPPTPPTPSSDPRTPSPAPSSWNATPSSSALTSISTASLVPAGSISRKSPFAKLGFGRRNTKPQSPASPDLPPPPQDDDGISLPWNFQHHVHVDEAYSGMPPSWTASLTEAGFNEEEIAAIYHRRALSPQFSASSAELQNPAYSTPISPQPAHAPLAHPRPRNSSLPRMNSQTSISQRSLSSNASQRRRPPVPGRKYSDASQTYSDHSSHESDEPPPLPSNPQYATVPAPIITSTSSSSSDSHEARARRPRTPPRRQQTGNLVVTNNPPTPFTPPPAYMSPQKDPGESFALLVGPEKQRPPAIVEPGAKHSPMQRQDTLEDPANLGPTTEPRRKPTSVAPPRLSLDSPLGDLTSWTEDLFSSIPSATEDDEQKPFADARMPPPRNASLQRTDDSPKSMFSPDSPGEGAFARRQRAVIEKPLGEESFTSRFSTVSSLSVAPDLDDFPQPPANNGAPTQKVKHKPVPLQAIQEPAIELDEPMPATTPLYNELMGMMQPGLTPLHSPALDECGSPIIPVTLSSPMRAAMGAQLAAARAQAAGSSTLSPMSAALRPHPGFPKSPTSPTSPRSDEGSVYDEDEDELLAPRDRTQRASNATVRPERDSSVTVKDVDGAIVSGAVVAYATRANVTTLGKPMSVYVASPPRSPISPTTPRSPMNPDPPHSPMSPSTPRSAESQRQKRGLSLLLDSVHQSMEGEEEGVTEEAEEEAEASEEGSGGSGSSRSGWSSSGSSRRQTMTLATSVASSEDGTPKSPNTPGLAYMEPSPMVASPQGPAFFGDMRDPLSPSPAARDLSMRGQVSHWIDDDEEEEEEEDDETLSVPPQAQEKKYPRPRIVISSIAVGPSGEEELTSKSASTGGTASPRSPNSAVSPVTPAMKYRGWLFQVVAPLEAFVQDTLDPRERYADLREIAEGESGSVFAARVVREPAPFPGAAASASTAARAWARAEARDESPSAHAVTVAIKNVPISPSGSPKIEDLRKELTLMKGLRHEHVLTMDALFVDLLEDSLWIRMELMERSLADVIGLVEEGLEVTEGMVARFVADMLSALVYLQGQGIAHRDVRSDNMLLNSDGILKLSDLTNGVKVTPAHPTCTDIAGVIYWQAPEVRSGSYNALKVDVWSVGATAWETVQLAPPFADVQDTREIGHAWPPLDEPDAYSQSFHDFLSLCSSPAASRPTPRELSATPFVRSACKRTEIRRLLAECKTIEAGMVQEDTDSQGTIS